MKKLLDKLILFVYVDALDFSKLYSLLGRTTFFKTVTSVRSLKNIPGYSFGIQSTLLTGKLPQQHMHWMPYIYLEKKAVEEERIRKLLVPLKYMFPLRFRYKSKVVEFMFKTCNNIFHYIAVNRKALLVSSPVEWYERVYIYPYYYMNDLPFFKMLSRKMNSKDFYTHYIGHTLSNCIKEFTRILVNFDKKSYEKLLLFLYIDDLDGIGHRYGVSTDKYSNKLLLIDMFLTKIFKLCKSISKDFILLIFSDHGMCDTVSKVNIIRVIEYIANYIDFAIIDSTLTFIWLKDESYIDDVITFLNFQLRDQAIILTPIHNKYELEEFGINFANREYGDIIVQLKPCKTFFPNFYSSLWWLKALHGFWPTEEVQKCFLALQGSTSSYEDLIRGVRSVTDIHNVLIKLTH